MIKKVSFIVWFGFHFESTRREKIHSYLDFSFWKVQENICSEKRKFFQVSFENFLSFFLYSNKEQTACYLLFMFSFSVLFAHDDKEEFSSRNSVVSVRKVQLVSDILNRRSFFWEKFQEKKVRQNYTISKVNKLRKEEIFRPVSRDFLRFRHSGWDQWSENVFSRRKIH